MMAWLRRLARVVLPGRGRHRGQPSRRGTDPPWWWKPWLPRRVEDEYQLPGEWDQDNEQWIRDLLPPTPPAPPAEPAEAWAPRITRWVRLACPVPDDTVLLSPVPAAAVLQLMARGFAWDQ
jgi:hypothetical protein